MRSSSVSWLGETLRTSEANECRPGPCSEEVEVGSAASNARVARERADVQRNPGGEQGRADPVNILDQPVLAAGEEERVEGRHRENTAEYGPRVSDLIQLSSKRKAVNHGVKGYLRVSGDLKRRHGKKEKKEQSGEGLIYWAGHLDPSRQKRPWGGIKSWRQKSSHTCGGCDG